MEFYQSSQFVKNHPLLQKITEVLETLDFDKLEKGMHQFNDQLYYNVIQYQSTKEENRVWESHRKEYDVHYIISGEERIYHNFLDQMTLADYDDKNDWQQMSGQKGSEIVLRQGNLLLLDANDAHMTGLMVNEEMTVKKIVFKLTMSLKKG
ncbi:hypothetical protein HMPREF9318_01038 [Streptococcus urinalis FB127-CNA-2]|uniref:YhcH/YjgK/YiaL family protein n=1 Tax=Streptococcus urinalis 2285-97 TaxID=764291 RepID=G5KHA1_9STRE|nr:YhcH/YjgK/YiaL family protein [Streptococcus urinalis]EHJ56577.1 YhcH/YjgK/YiaL family protein [Streptococcus urinalis 2285-97]EKS21084.1 hypothetical protein HMPREF9318_01038 [Streptococcus urinalis FB127-CNA-2]VEF31093.1 beta-galactosidase subunit beta [Streptococcus urinalis]